MTWLFVLQFCVALSGQCVELAGQDGSRRFSSRESCLIEIQFVRVEGKGRLSCQERAFEAVVRPPS